MTTITSIDQIKPGDKIRFEGKNSLLDMEGIVLKISGLKVEFKITKAPLSEPNTREGMIGRRIFGDSAYKRVVKLNSCHQAKEIVANALKAKNSVATNADPKEEVLADWLTYGKKWLVKIDNLFSAARTEASNLESTVKEQLDYAQKIGASPKLIADYKGVLAAAKKRLS